MAASFSSALGVMSEAIGGFKEALKESGSREDKGHARTIELINNLKSAGGDQVPKTRTPGSFPWSQN